MAIRWPILMKLYVLWSMLAISDLMFFGYCGVNCIVNHDLLLTPQQGYHWQHSKRVFYKDSLEHNQGLLSQQQQTNESTIFTQRPWEHTLKHVTYLTIFANTTNNSGVKFYESFQQSPYYRSGSLQDIRFGDIVTLAQGRLERLEGANQTYQFVEDTCNGVIIFKCSTIDAPPLDEKVIAIWLVQRIRHRDKDHQFIYDIRFSIKPSGHFLTQFTADKSNSFNRKVENKYNNLELYEEKATRDSLQKSPVAEDLSFRSYIQRLSDYPNSLRILNYTHQMGNNSYGFERRQGFSYYPSTMSASATTYPLNNRSPLNIGEYYKDHKIKSHFTRSPPTNINHRRNSILPNLLNLMFGKSPTPDSMLPHQISTKKPFRNPHFETIHLDEHPGSETNLYKFNEIKIPHSSPFKATVPTPPIRRPSSPMVTHHFHHYYYLPPPASSTNINEAVKLEETPIPAQLINMEQFNSYHTQPQQFPSSTDYSLINNMKQEHMIIASPTTPALPYLQRPPVASAPLPHIHPVHEETEQQTFDNQAPVNYISNQLPLYIYPAYVEETMLNHRISPPTTSVLPPFKESELDTGFIRYSDPDPIYHGTIKEQELYRNYDKSTDKSLYNAKSFVNSYQNQFKESQVSESAWQGREKLSHESNGGARSKQNSFSSKEAAYSLGRTNISKNVISKTRSTDIFKSGNKSTISEPEIHNNVLETITQSSTTIQPQESSTIEADTLPVITTIETSLDKNIKVDITPTNSGKQIPTPIKARSRNKTDSTNHETLTTTTTMPTTTVTPYRRSLTTTSSPTLSNTLISPRVIRKLKTVRVVAGEEKDYDSSYGDGGDKQNTQSSFTEEISSITTTTSKPLEKAVLRWKLKRKTSDRESASRRNHIYSNYNNISRVTAKTIPTRNRKTTLKMNDSGSITKIPSKPLLEEGVNYMVSEISGSNSSVAQFPGMRKLNKNVTFHGTMTTTPTPSGKVYEVLTQKSISKSVSFKVGANGEQIVLINDDILPDKTI